MERIAGDSGRIGNSTLFSSLGTLQEISKAANPTTVDPRLFGPHLSSTLIIKHGKSLYFGCALIINSVALPLKMY